MVEVGAVNMYLAPSPRADISLLSTDYGSTYDRMNDKVGTKTVLSYLYVCPTNKRKIMVLTDPEFESSVLISSDEGASFQKYRLTFYILSLLFHHTEEDWALAYSHDQKDTGKDDHGPNVFVMRQQVLFSGMELCTTSSDSALRLSPSKRSDIKVNDGDPRPKPSRCGVGDVEQEGDDW
ncbi:hypothetical protein NQZ68_014267 [Dissostichus eleginoides]|nr:hypothetical protein NQZ68_014267 [Dissostichus eleginoides]